MAALKCRKKEIHMGNITKLNLAAVMREMNRSLSHMLRDLKSGEDKIAAKKAAEKLKREAKEQKNLRKKKAQQDQKKAKEDEVKQVSLK